MVCDRVYIKAEQCAIDVDKIERDSGLFIDTFNSQELLFVALKEFTKKGRNGSIRDLELVAQGLKETPIGKCEELLNVIDLKAKNQMQFYEMHKGIIQTNSESQVDNFSLPQDEI